VWNAKESTNVNFSWLSSFSSPINSKSYIEDSEADNAEFKVESHLKSAPTNVFV
jgi:hypothetical protein